MLNGGLKAVWEGTAADLCIDCVNLCLTLSSEDSRYYYYYYFYYHKLLYSSLRVDETTVGYICMCVYIKYMRYLVSVTGASSKVLVFS